MTKPRSAQTITKSTLKTSFVPSLKQRYLNVVNVLKISQKEKNLSIATPKLFGDMPEVLPTNSITENSEEVNTLGEKNSKQLNDEDSPIADNNKKHSQDELRATLEAKVSNIVNVLKISQKEKISSTVTPQQAFDDMRDLSINSIPEKTEKVNTSDEKNSKPLNDEAPLTMMIYD